jgi:hypothetical protein
MLALASCVTLATVPGEPCRADEVERAAEVLSDGHYWLERTVPLTLTLLGGDQEERIGRRMLDTQIAAALATEGLKRLTRQGRPDDPDAGDGFPSGHAASAWALAEAVGTEEPDLRPYTYTYAAAVTWSRVRLERHSVAQALAGAALGYGIARVSASSRHGLFGRLFVHDGSPEATAFTGDPHAPPSCYQRPTVVLWEARW